MYEDIININNSKKVIGAEIQTKNFNSEMAKEFLEKTDYSGQRIVNKKRVDRHLKRLENGSWFPSLIVVGTWKKSGKKIMGIFDGQHRLHAIKKADTSDEYPLLVLYLHISKEDVPNFYQMFDEKTSARSLDDLVRFKLSQTEKPDRWNRPVYLVRALAYASGHWFTEKGLPVPDGQTKDEFQSNFIFLTQYYEAFDFVDGIIDQMPGSTRAFFGVKGYGVILDSFIRDRGCARVFWNLVADYGKPGNDIKEDYPLIRRMFEKADALKTAHLGKKGVEPVPKFFLLYWKTFYNFRNNLVRLNGRYKTATKKDVLKECFAKGTCLRNLS